MSGTLLVAATEMELCGYSGLVCGVGPVEASAATSRRLAHAQPAAVLNVGIAGAHGFEPGTIVIGSTAVYCDIAAAIPTVGVVDPEPSLIAAVSGALTLAPLAVIGTSGAVGSVTRDVAVEAMEGFGVLRAAQLAGIPAIEVRAISNEIGEADRARWRIDDALAALRDAIPRLVAALRDY
jgi:futalosine hydrolase